VRMRTWLPMRMERLWWLRGLRRLLRVLGTLPLVLDARLTPSRRFPPPWSIEDIGAAFVVKDSTGQKHTFVPSLGGQSKCGIDFYQGMET